MLAPAVLAIIAATILVTSFISGIFGMAGGIILLGVLLIFLDVAPAMVLFGTIQTASNGWRAALWLRYVDWGIVWRYLVGSTLMFLALRSVAILPSKAMHLSRARPHPVRRRSAAEAPDARHHAARRALHLRRLHHRAAAAGGCGRPHPRRVLPEEPHGPQVDRRHQGGDAGDGPPLPHRLFRLVRGHLRREHPLVGLCGGDRAGVCRHLAGGAGAAPHDRRGLPHVEPARHASASA